MCGGYDPHASVRQSFKWCQCREQGQGASVVGWGLQGLVGGVTAGVTGVVRAPLQGYNDGSGVIAGKHA